MADNKKISELDAASSAADTDNIVLGVAALAKRLTIALLRTAILKLTALTAITTADDTDHLLIDDAGVAKKMTVANAKTTLAPAFQGALVKLTGAEIMTTGNSVPWDEEIYDVGDWWDSGEPTRLTVPTGVTRVRVSGSIYNSVVPTDGQAMFFKNGAAFDGSGYERHDNANQANGLRSAVLEVTPGDYFEYHMIFSGSQTIRVDILGGQFFGIEAVN